MDIITIAELRLLDLEREIEKDRRRRLVEPVRRPRVPGFVTSAWRHVVAVASELRPWPGALVRLPRSEAATKSSSRPATTGSVPAAILGTPGRASSARDGLAGFTAA